MMSSRRLSTSSRVQDRRKEFCDISSPDVATPPALLALPGANSTPASWKTSTASGVHGMLAPSPTAITLLATSIMASSPLSSFCVAHGSATSTFTFQRPFTDGSGALAVNVADGYCFAYSEIRPRRLFLRSMTQANFSRSMPSGSWMKPDESEKVTGLPPRSSTFSQANWATFPDPEIETVAPSNDLPLVANISRAK